jgi:phosphoribosylformylglycinamidine synthase subunit PurL
VAEQRVFDFMREARSLVSRAVALGRGGLLITLARCCALSELGAEVRLADAWRNIAPVALLFGEAQSRCLLTVPGEAWPALQDLARPLEVPLHKIGTVGGTELRVKGAVNLDLGRVNAWS